MRNRFRTRSTGTAVAAVLLATGVGAGCGNLDSSQNTAEASESADQVADGKVCPKKLPAGTKAGSETDAPAEEAPSLPEPESAWICQYNPGTSGSGLEGGSGTGAWKLVGEAERVADADVSELADDLTKLTPAEAQQMCTADLGPRWMLVYSHGQDLSGVVVDDFGCRDVRLTDDPFETVPGGGDQEGTVPGTLAAPTALLNTLKQLHRR